MSRIDVSINLTGGVFQLYKYEPFGGNTFKVNQSVSGDTLSFASSSPELSGFLTLTDASKTVIFASATGPSVSYSGLILTITDLCSGIPMQSNDYTVNINAGRFLTPSNLTNFTFYKNEPIRDVSFIGSIPINKPVSTTSLPVGLQFYAYDTCTYLLRGTPTIQTPQSNYNIIASGLSNTSRVINTNVGIVVNTERLLLDISGTGISSNARVGTDISQIVVTGRCPPYTGSLVGKNIKYTWTPSLPEGLRFSDASGTTLSNGSVPSVDLCSTIILRGSITSNGIQSLSSSNLNITLTGTRVTTPAITSNVGLRVVFDETVVFTTPVFANLYKNSSISSSAVSNRIYARTLFASVDGSIASITSSNLASGVTLDFSLNGQFAALTGTPDVSGVFTSDFVASNSNAKSATLPVTYTINQDSVSFTQVPTDICYSFILERNLSNAKTGYYSSPLDFYAKANSGCNVTMTITGISGTGLSFTYQSSNAQDGAKYRLEGTPCNVTSLSAARITATASATSSSNTKDISYSILADKFTFSDASLQVIQNVAMTPVTIVATPLSDLPVLRYSSTTLPTGLTISAGGTITGTPRGSSNGTFGVFASTGVTSDTCTFPFTILPDSLLLLTPQPSYTYLAGANVSIPVSAVSFSGRTVSNFQLAGFPSIGLSINSSTGLISGTLTNGVPPNALLPTSNVNFDVCAYAGISLGTLPSTLSITNPIVSRSYLINSTNGSGSELRMYTLDVSDYANVWSTSSVVYNSNSGMALLGEQPSAFKMKNSNVDGNTFIIASTNSNGRLIRSTDGVNFSNIELPSVTTSDKLFTSAIVNITDTSTWYTCGVDSRNGTISDSLFLKKSTDDGVTWGFPRKVTTGTSNVLPRDIGDTPADKNGYLTGGCALAYKSGRFLVGGRGDSTQSMLLSTDDGATWSIPTGNTLSSEIAQINVDGSLWIATGSQRYTTLNPSSYGSLSNAYTIMYSDTSGSGWSNVALPSGDFSNSTGSFNVFGYDITYGNGCWIASGISYYATGVEGVPQGDYFYPELRVSSDGSNWQVIRDTAIPIISNANLSNPIYPVPYGPISYFNGAWNIVVHQLSGSTYTPYWCVNSNATFGSATDLLSNWTRKTIGLPFLSNMPSYKGFFAPQYVRTGSPTYVTLSFSNTSATGPTFTSPSQTAYTLFQHMQVAPIVFSATGTGRVYYFVDIADLPLGLTWNAYTATVTGKSVELGEDTFTVYAKDDLGVSSLTVRVTTVVPRVVRQQIGAAAYTSLVKQYTEVNAGQAARDNRTFPADEPIRGKFMAPPAPDVITPSNCEC